MKLIYCPDCHDVVRLMMTQRRCECGKCYGQYRQDGLHADISDGAVPIGFDNLSFVRAARRRGRKAEKFTAFVIENNCPTVHVET